MTTTMAEPEWDQETRDLAIAFTLVDLCGVCGRPTVICQNPDTQYDWVGNDPVRCHATTAVLARQAGVTEASNPQVDALLWSARLRTEGGDHA